MTKTYVYSPGRKLKFEQKFGNRLLIFVRHFDMNKKYLSSVAAMAFNKALFGISELKALETYSKEKESGGLRLSKAINTYYIIYHLMSLCMLLDKNYEIKINKIDPIKGGPLEVDCIELNKSDESPARWKEQRFIEDDLATLIGHKHIKDYCELARKQNIQSPIKKLFYKNFISIRSKLILYEKICYIRDRSVYRPTVLLDKKTGEYIQTSADVRDEIDNLPGWNTLYQFVTELHNQILYLSTTYKDYRFKYFLSYLWNGTPIKEKREFLTKIGWTDNDIDTYSVGNCKDLAFSGYIAHLMEISDIDRVREDINIIWNPLRKKYDENISKILKI